MAAHTEKDRFVQDCTNLSIVFYKNPKEITSLDTELHKPVTLIVTGLCNSAVTFTLNMKVLCKNVGIITLGT